MIRLPVPYYDDNYSNSFVKEYRAEGASKYLAIRRSSSGEKYVLTYKDNDYSYKIKYSQEPKSSEDWVWAKLEKFDGKAFIIAADGPADREFALYIKEIV